MCFWMKELYNSASFEVSLTTNCCSNIRQERRLHQVHDNQRAPGEDLSAPSCEAPGKVRCVAFGLFPFADAPQVATSTKIENCHNSQSHLSD